MSQDHSTYSPEVFTSHNPYTMNTNFNTRSAPFLRPGIATFTNEFKVLPVSKFPKLPMYNPFPDEVVRVNGCVRVFLGGTSYNTAVGVAEALIAYTDVAADPTRVVKVNYCKPQFTINMWSAAVCEAARAVLVANGYHLLPADHDDEGRNGVYRLKVAMSSYRVAVATPRTIDALLQQAIPNQTGDRLWEMKKNTGGIQLVMLPQHALRLLNVSQTMVQDTDDSLIVATTCQSCQQINLYLKDTARQYADAARLMCAPMRFVSVEERGAH